MEDLINLYYDQVCGSLPDEDWKVNQTKKTIEFLVDCGFGYSELFKLFGQLEKDVLRPEDLPDSLWDYSLIKRGRFYYHSELRITSKPPTFDPRTGKEVKEPFFVEIKIRYTLDNLVDYYIKAIKPPIIDEKKIKAGLDYLLKYYSKSIKIVTPLDFVLALIDTAKYNHTKIINVFDIQKNEVEVFNSLSKMVAEAKFAGKDVIVWRQ